MEANSPLSPSLNLQPFYSEEGLAGGFCIRSPISDAMADITISTAPMGIQHV